MPAVASRSGPPVRLDRSPPWSSPCTDASPRAHWPAARRGSHPLHPVRRWDTGACGCRIVRPRKASLGSGRGCADPGAHVGMQSPWSDVLCAWPLLASADDDRAQQVRTARSSSPANVHSGQARTRGAPARIMAAARTASRQGRDSGRWCSPRCTQRDHPSVHCTLGCAIITSLGLVVGRNMFLGSIAGKRSRFLRSNCDLQAAKP